MQADRNGKNESIEELQSRTKDHADKVRLFVFGYHCLSSRSSKFQALRRVVKGHVDLLERMLICGVCV